MASYHETLCSLVYPGATASRECLKPTLGRMEILLGLPLEKKHRTVVRIDGGFGTDANLNRVLWRGYPVLAKAYSGKRAQAYARRVESWQTLRPQQRWIARVEVPPVYCRPIRAAVLRWRTESGQIKHALLICSLTDLPLEEVAELYDGRGAIESEIKSDKVGLAMPKRRKRSLAAQEALILLTDLAHNLLAWLHPWMLEGSPFEGFGPQRLVRDVLAIPGKVIGKEGQPLKVRLKESHPYAKPVLVCLKRLFDRFGTPPILGEN